jgi:PAS domain S-box-containing protein
MNRESGLRSQLKTPALSDSEIARQVDTIQTVMLPLFGGALIFACVAVAFFPDGMQSSLISLGIAGLLALCVAIARSGRPRAAAIVIVSLLWLVATVDLLLGGGVSAPGQGVYLVAILMAAFVVSLRAAIVTTAITVATTGFVSWVASQESLPESIIARDPVTYWFAQVIIFVAVTGVVWVALRRIRQAVDEAQQSERDHRLVADSVDDFIWSLNADNEFIYASPAVEEILGFSQKEILGRQASQAQLVPGSVDVAQLIEEAIKEGRHTLRYEAQQLRKDGSPVWCEFSTRLEVDEDGQFLGSNGVTREISKRKRAEARQHELEDQLRQSQKMEAVGQLAGGIAHDFNNYLTVILGNAEMLALESDGEKRSLVSEILDAARRSADLTHQLLAFSRKQVLEPRVLDLNRAIRDGRRLLHRVLGEDIAIETISDQNLGHVEVDPNQLEQIILNLAVNARAAMPDGGRLTIEMSDVYLDSEFAERRLDVKAGQYVMLAVSDNGIGMDELTRKRIFEPFFTTKEVGNGLGLSTVHGIVTQSGGTIDVSSKSGQGTTFRIYLPRVDPAIGSPSKSSDLSLASEDLGSETVLVVEDQEMVRRLIRRMLEIRGFRVLTAADRDEAIAIVEDLDEDIDLLLTDIVLPGTNGVKLAKELEDRIGVRVLYMSGFTQGGIVHRGVVDSRQLLLQKPFTTDQLVAKIRQALAS